MACQRSTGRQRSDRFAQHLLPAWPPRCRVKRPQSPINTLPLCAQAPGGFLSGSPSSRVQAGRAFDASARAARTPGRRPNDRMPCAVLANWSGHGRAARRTATEAQVSADPSTIRAAPWRNQLASAEHLDRQGNPDATPLSWRCWTRPDWTRSPRSIAGSMRQPQGGRQRPSFRLRGKPRHPVRETRQPFRPCLSSALRSRRRRVRQHSRAHPG